MNHFFQILVELVSGLIFLFAVTKVLGKTQFSQVTPFDFISALMLGELVGNAVYDDKISIWEIAFATFVWGVLIYILEMLTQKFKGTRKFLEGEPSVVIRKGQISYLSLKKLRLDINQLQSLIRQQGYFSIQEVEYAIMETNGKVSVLPKSDYDTPKKGDLNLPSMSVILPVTIIIDGEVIYDNLKDAGFDETWLKDQLAMQNITNHKDVLYAEWLQNQPLYVNKY
ncbi:MAG: YetF domain-containing protein [Bacillus sp. (in: firmicutes)]